jgi:ABC-2 type transport system permease protein
VNPGPARLSPIGQLVLSRLREYWREPETIFWVFGFPVLMVIALGIAFRDKPLDRISVDLEDGPGAEAALRSLRAASRPGDLLFVARRLPAPECARRLRTGRTDVVVRVHSGRDTGAPSIRFAYDRARAEGRLARAAVEDALQRSSGRRDPIRVLPDELQREPGGRYIDFLIPGLVGMSLMGGGLWGVGYVIVDSRIRKLLKRYLATPMKRSHFLGSILISRLVFMIPEVVFVLVFARLAFGVHVYGSLAALSLLVLLGAVAFGGIGLLVASRARTLETASGLMNLVMLPMWILSGIFFSSERYPEVVQPFIRALPLTPLIDSLRAVMLEGATLASQLVPALTLGAWGLVTFVLALAIFRWT